MKISHLFRYSSNLIIAAPNYSYRTAYQLIGMLSRLLFIMFTVLFYFFNVFGVFLCVCNLILVSLCNFHQQKK